MNPEFNPKNMMTENNTQIPEKELHQQFVILGNNRRKLTNELLALLPEIYERGIYKKYASTIVEYAGKFGGLSKGVVMKRLRLEKYLEDKPNLKEAIKTEGVHKVALVAKLATAETENVWVDKLKNMSKASLFELAKEVRGKAEDKKCMSVDKVGICESSVGVASNVGIGGGNGSRVDFGYCKAAPQKVKIELEGELLFMFLKMKKKYGKNLSNKEVMKKILEEAVNLSEAGQSKTNDFRHKDGDFDGGKEASKQIKAESVSIIPQSYQQKVQIFPGKKVTRYVKVEIKKSVLSSTNGKCSYPGCENPAENLHHPERFAESQNHNNLKPLCKIHHEFMHNGLVKNEQSSVESWQLELDGKLDEIDCLYRKYRGAAI